MPFVRGFSLPRLKRPASKRKSVNHSETAAGRLQMSRAVQGRRGFCLPRGSGEKMNHVCKQCAREIDARFRFVRCTPCVAAEIVAWEHEVATRRAASLALAGEAGRAALVKWRAELEDGRRETETAHAADERRARRAREDEDE